MKRKLNQHLLVSKRPCVASSLEDLMRWPERILDGLCPSLNGRTLDADGGVVSSEENMQDSENELRLKFTFMWGVGFLNRLLWMGLPSMGVV